MAKVKIQGNASGTGVITLIAPNTNTDRTVTLPDESITLGGGVDGIVSTANATAITIDSSEKVSLGGSTAVTVDSQVAIHGGNLELTTAGARYWIPRASDGVLTGSLYSPTGSEVRLAGSGTSSGSISFEPSSTSGKALEITSDGRGLSQFTAKAWVKFNGTGTVAIRDSHNVSSITDNGTGNYRINFTNSIGSNFAVSCAGRLNQGTVALTEDATTSYANIYSYYQHNNSYKDNLCVHAVMFGD